MQRENVSLCVRPSEEDYYCCTIEKYYINVRIGGTRTCVHSNAYQFTDQPQTTFFIHSNKLDNSTMKSKSVGAGAATMDVGMSDNTIGRFLSHPTISHKLVCS